jgi:hypothetical protein
MLYYSRPSSLFYGIPHMWHIEQRLHEAWSPIRVLPFRFSLHMKLLTCTLRCLAFVDLWGLPHGSIVRVEQLCGLLPSHSDCLQYFTHYRDTAHVLYPGVSDIQQFEHDLTNFLISRGSDEIYSDGNELATQKAYGKDLHWIGLLFATLASGCQCSSRPRKERQLTSQVYSTFRSSNLEKLRANI